MLEPPTPDPELALPAPEPELALPAPENDAPPQTVQTETIHPGELSGDLALRMLYDQQTRLRAELDELRRKQKEKDKDAGGKDKDADHKDGDGKKNDGEKSDDKDKKEDDVKDGKDDKKGGEDKDDKEKDGKDKEEMPPLKDRVIGWIKEHPGYTILIVAGVIVLIIAGILLMRYLNSYENTDDAFVDGHTDPIGPRISGIVMGVYVENTYHVAKGQLLVELDPRDNEVAREQAQANYAQAQAGTRAQSPNIPITQTDQSTRVSNENLNIVNARASVAAAEERYRSALADLQQAEATEANAAREEERYRLLVDKQEVSREQYDQRATEQRADAAAVASRREVAAAAQKSVTQAQAQLGQAEQQEQQAKQDLPRQVAMQKEQLAQRRASEMASKAQADQAELNLQYTRIYAPEDGIIGDKQVQVGTQVEPGQELFALTQTNDVWVTANFKETQIRRMRPGQSVTINVDALNTKFEGYIEALPGASGAVYSLLPPENATGNYVKVVQRLPVRIRFKPNQPGAERLAPGMSVEPKVWLR